MASDAHVHPYYLKKEDCEAEDERTALNIRCAASSFNIDEFIYNETLAKKETSPYMALCFGVHPQLPAHNKKNPPVQNTGHYYPIDRLLLFLETLAREKRITAVGEAGFDLFDSDYKETEKIQEEIFIHHITIAEQYGLPLVLHVRRAMHKIFMHTKKLKHIPAVVFHSYSGSPDEAQSLIKRGINAYFSFGTTILKNHKNALCAAAALPSGRLLFETDAPYQPLYQQKYSRYSDIFTIIKRAAELRAASGDCTVDRTARGLEEISDNNFNIIFGGNR
jgi:TatD DNase family protein